MLSEGNQASIRESFCSAGEWFRDAAQELFAFASELRTPSVVFRPRLSLDGNKWCAMYGENLQDGVAGFGDSPAEACADFDKKWHASIP